MNFPSLYVSASATVLPIPFRLRVLRSLTSIIEQVNPTKGQHFDLRGAVFRGRARFGDDDPTPMVSILEAPIPQGSSQSKGDNTKVISEWELLIQGWSDDDRRNPSDAAHHLMAEVKSVLVREKKKDRGNNLLGMGGRVVEMYVGQGTVRPPDDPVSEAFFWLTLTLRLAEDLEQPYA
jgi:hypothetical protein